MNDKKIQFQKYFLQYVQSLSLKCNILYIHPRAVFIVISFKFLMYDVYKYINEL